MITSWALHMSSAVMNGFQVRKTSDALSGFWMDTARFGSSPLILNPDHSKLSKRQGDVAVEDYLDSGYLPEALINFVALLGFNPSGDQRSTQLTN